MKQSLYFLIFLLMFLTTQVFAEEINCVQNYSRQIENSLPSTNFIAGGYCTYPDETRSASSLTCFDLDCCDYYLTGTHTKAGIQYKSWRYINQLNCIDWNGKSKTYINGKDSDTPTTINTEKVNIAETHGDNSPAVAGDNNVINQGENNSWFSMKNPFIRIIFTIIAGVILIIIKRLFFQKSP